MDQASAIKVLQNYGAPMTPRNLQLVMSQAGGDSAILGKSMGLQGGGDEAGYDDSILKNALDKLDVTSQRGPVAATPETVASNTNPITDAPTPIAKAPVVAATPNKGRSGSAASTEPEVVPAANTAQAGPSIWQWLLPALGITSAAGYKSMAPPQGEVNISGRSGIMPEAKIPTGPAITPMSGATPQTDAIDKLMGDSSKGAPTESSRPINTNTDERNSEPVNKPTNLESKAQAKGPYDDEPTNLVEEIAKTIRKLKSVRK